MDNPLVTVNILSFNRREDLRLTLRKVFEQDYENIEVIVVDNNSTDGTQNMVKEEFPNVTLIELTENIGIAGWNKGFEIAKGEYVLVLDDDSYPEEGVIREGVKNFISDEKLAVIAYNIYNLRIKQSQTKSYKYNSIEFVGCGAMMSSRIFFLLKGFDENIFIYAHELDYSIRVLKEGYKIIYLKNAIVHHMSMLTDRGHPLLNDNRLVWSTISTVIILKKYLKPSRLDLYYFYVVKIFASRILIAIYFREFKFIHKIISHMFYKFRKRSIDFIKINDELLKRYDYLNVGIFDYNYFGSSYNKIILYKVFFFIKTFFQSKERKIKRISY